MKTHTLASFTLAVLTGAAVSGAELFELPEAGDWKNSSEISAKPGDILSFTGKGELHGTEKIKIDATKTTRVSVDAKKDDPAAGKVTLMVSFWIWDKDNRQITPKNITPVAGTETVLAAPCKKGDKVLLLKNGAGVKPGMVAAFETKADLSDLPNFKITDSPVASVEARADGCAVTFKSPVRFDYPAGTALRMHQQWGGYFYANIVQLSDEFKTYSVEIKGNGAEKGVKWWPGTASVEPVLFQLDKKPSSFKNYKIEILDK